MANLLTTGLSALNAFQRSLTTTGHNIANVNTEGYSRQTVDLVARRADTVGVGFLGNGVEVNAIERQYDDFLAGQYRQYNASQSGLELYNQRVSMIDNLVADPDSGLSSVFQGYFNAVQDVAADPTSVPARQVMLNESEQLAARFRSLDAWMADMNRQVNSDLEGYASQITQLSGSIADLNGAIAEATGSGRAPNDLLDRRDQLLDELSGLVSVSTVRQDNGAVNVFIGSGQALVVDGRASRMSVAVDPANAQDRIVRLVPPGGATPVTVTEQLTGGAVGGLLDFKEDVLNPTRDQLGVLAVGFTLETNRLHAGDPANPQGPYDLDGQLGGNYFEPLTLDYGEFSLTAEDAGALQPTAYELTYSGGSWSMRREGGAVQALTLDPVTNDAVFDGLRITVTGTPADGTSYRVRPYREAAGAFDVAVNDPRAIAANGSVDPNAVGGNQNALAMAGLQSSQVLYGGTASFSDGYNTMVADVGTKARESADGAAVQANLASQTNAVRQSVSGVNLDEEAANLVKFQQSYQAAAQVIAVANTLFDTLLGAVRR